MNHKKLDVWIESMKLVRLVYDITKNLPKEELYGLTSQIKRSVISIPSNIAEGAARKSDKEFIYFLNIARGSLAELETQLIITKELFNVHNSLVEEKIEVVGKLINGLISYLFNKKDSNMIKDDQIEYETNHQSPITNHQSPITNHNSPITNHQSPITPDSNRDHYFAHETAVIDDGCQIGEETKIWHFSHIMSNCKIGKNCNIGQNVVVSPGVVLGNQVKVQNNVSIYTGVICEDDVFLGPSVVFTNISNPRSAVIRKDQYEATIVRKGASIGANATIVCGNNIGEYAFIGAGAVVTKEVKPYALIVGNPAKQIGWISEFGHKLSFNDGGEAICPESNEEYVLKNNCVTKVNK